MIRNMIRIISADIANSMLTAHYLGPVRRARVLMAFTDGEAVAVYGWPTRGNIRHGLPATELMRLWSPDEYSGTLSQFLAATLKELQRYHPEINLVVAYADPEAGHHGGIYRASNWIYTGHASQGGPQAMIINGERVHARTVNHRYGHADRRRLEAELGVTVTPIKRVPKHTYYYPLTKSARKILKEIK